MTKWRLHHKAVTASTNLDARSGAHGDAFTADYQTSGRGRLDHRWMSPPGTNLMMSVVLSVKDVRPETLATLPLVAGLAVVNGLKSLLGDGTVDFRLKWPNDVWMDGKKVAGILCELNGENVIVGMGVNVGRQSFPAEIADKAVSLASAPGVSPPSVPDVRDAVLEAIGDAYGRWTKGGFAAVYGEIAALDCLRGKMLSVRQTDADPEPACGVSRGINPDGSLDVGGTAVYAGEARVERIG